MDLSIYGDTGDYTCDKSKKYKYSGRGTYVECYPGGRALGDSDDEADYSKMDNGTKKGQEQAQGGEEEWCSWCPL